MTATSMNEEIKVGELAIRFVIEGEGSGESVAAFEFDVPAGARVAAAHSHDGFEETIYGLEGVLTWTVDGARPKLRPARRSSSLGARSTTSTTPATSTRRHWRLSPPASSARTTSMRWLPSSMQARGRRISRRSRQ